MSLSLRRIGVNSSLNVQQNSPVEPSGPQIVAVVVRRLLITYSMFLFVIGVFSFLFLHDSVFVSCIFLGIYPFF